MAIVVLCTSHFWYSLTDRLTPVVLSCHPWNLGFTK